MAGYAISAKSSPDIVYIQFYPDGCKDKRKYTKVFFDDVKKENKLFPDFEISEDVVLPSKNTIDLGGESWKKQ